MKYIGALLLVSVVLVAAYYLLATTVDTTRVLVLAGVGLAIGSAIMLCDRLTRVTIPGVGELTATVEQAKADANEISDVKSRIEAQSATVDLVAKQAISTVDQMRDIACVNAKASLTNSMAAGFMGGMSLKHRLDLNDRVINSLKEIGVSEEKIEDVKEMWSKGVGLIYHRGIRHVLEGRTQRNHINMQASPALRQASQEFQDMRDFSQWEVPSPGEMEAFIEEKGFMNDTLRELIADYRHFLDTGEIRRRDVFLQL